MIETMSDFDLHFEGVYGARWPLLKQTLLKPSVKVSRPCFGGFAAYTLDQASIIAALALPINAGDQVLDLCAAPGGKALILLEELIRQEQSARNEAGLKTIAGSGSFIANELSFARRKRLEEVIRTHVPAEYQTQVKITAWDASKVGVRGTGRFDKILLDAPCSSERHLLEQDSVMKEWKVSRTKQLAQRQYALICSALLALKPGGEMVYSTCSISPLENDGVVERLLERKGDQVECVELDVTELELKTNFYCTMNLNLEKTQYGFQIFPDQSAGQGPIYFACLKKKFV